MKVLVTGAEGLVGSVLCPYFREQGHEVFPFSHAALDITDERAVGEKIGSIKPDAVVNAGAMTDVDISEKNPEQAFAANARGPENMARACRQSGAALLHLSTDYVFDGAKGSPYDEEDAPEPISVYGLSKLEGERAVRGILPSHYIVRTSFVFGASRANFVKSILLAAKKGGEVKAYTDLSSCPTYNRDIAKACLAILTARTPGMYHMANSGGASRYAIAEKILGMAPENHATLKAVTLREAPRPARRPANSMLACARLEKLGFTVRPWEDAVREFIAEIWEKL